MNSEFGIFLGFVLIAGLLAMGAREDYIHKELMVKSKTIEIKGYISENQLKILMEDRDESKK